MSNGYNRAATLALCIAQAMLHLIWTPGSQATKYTKIFATIFGNGRFSWCGAFQTWCMINCGAAPLGTIRAIKSKAPPGYEHYTFALVEYWQQWAMANGLYHHASSGYVPQPGDQIIYDWDKIKADSGWDDHIGMLVNVRPDGQLNTAEGNTGNQTALKIRPAHFVNGYIHIPDGFEI